MRIAIVNDMVIAVEAMRRVLLKAHGHELAWVARDGSEAVERSAQDTPDLILMDLIMPKMDGVEATRRIMARNPCAIVIVTASVNQNTSKVFEAMGVGALDAVNTPTIEEPGAPDGAAALLGKIKTIHRLIGDNTGKNAHWDPPVPGLQKSGRRPQLIAIGASAGGPAALGVVLSHLPRDFSAAVLIVQHVDCHFAEGLADWLTQETHLRVRLAKDGDHPQPGRVLLAGMEDHMVFVSPSKLGYAAQPLNCLYRPSVDVFFNSILRFWRGEVICVLFRHGPGWRRGFESIAQCRVSYHCAGQGHLGRFRHAQGRH